MRQPLHLLAILISLPLLACGSTSIGDTCPSGGCDSGQLCREDFPGTFCTQSCTQEGQQGGCPEDSICTRQFDTLLCAPVCKSQGDCRESYACNGTTGSDVKACQIKLP